MLSQLLDQFADLHGNCRIEPEPIDLTECFRRPYGGYDGPRSYGRLPENRVIAYTMRGAALMQKYRRGQNGGIILENGKPKVFLDNPLAKVMSCLCLYDIRNTSLREIRDALKITDGIQGYKRRHVFNIEEALFKERMGFEPEHDTAFIFAGPEGAVYSRLELQREWLSQMLRKGGAMLDRVNPHEATLMEKVLPRTVLDGDDIPEHSYMHGSPTHMPESSEFLQKKVSAYQRFMRRDGSPLFVGMIDTAGGISYSLAVGAGLDLASGLDWRGVAASRASATVFNFLFGGLYGRWRDIFFRMSRTGEECSRFRKAVVDFGAFNTFQTPIYGVALSVGNIMQDGEVDPAKIATGLLGLTLLSPFVAPMMGAYMSWIRKRANIRSPEERAGSAS